jgi:hypothetical protein
MNSETWGFHGAGGGGGGDIFGLAPCRRVCKITFRRNVLPPSSALTMKMYVLRNDGRRWGW